MFLGLWAGLLVAMSGLLLLTDFPQPAAGVMTAAIVVFNGLTLGLLGGGAACLVLAVLLLGRMPERVVGGASPDTQGGGAGPLPAGPSSANVEP
ncbi:MULTISPECIES: hypothetical protein [unclassified Arthrobacter]|uniref:hypothetical protein n=1 Tax=unclassified Arthrobacter TaxID=235627 RepID=UPI003396F6AB